MSGQFLTFDDKGLSYIPKASDMPMTKKNLFLIILNNIVYYTFCLQQILLTSNTGIW